MAAGELEMGIVTSGPFVNYAPDMGVLDLPFLFGSSEEAYAVLDGEVGQELLGSLEAANLKGLAYAERGFRNVTNSVRPVTTKYMQKHLMRWAPMQHQWHGRKL